MTKAVGICLVELQGNELLMKSQKVLFPTILEKAPHARRANTEE